MSGIELMDLTKISRNFPKQVSSLQIKENFLDTVEKIFEGGTIVVQVEGEEGIGKTTLMSQFALRYPMNTISLFITPANRQDYHPEIVRLDFANQLHWIINQRELEQTRDFNDSFLRSCFFRLQRNASRRSTIYYIIIDGLSDIPDEDRQFRDNIIDMLPIGLKGFLFLITIDSGKSFKSIELRHGVKTKPFFIPGFNLDETRKYLQEFKLELTELTEIQQTCRGIPGRLASVKRILNDGMKIQELIDILPDRLPDLFDIEWAKINSTGLTNKILAIMAHDRKYHNIDEIARITKADEIEVEYILKKLGFVNVNQETGQVSYISEAFRKFAAEKTAKLKQDIITLFINDLMSDPNSVAALEQLPGYYNQAGRYDNLLEYLTPTNFQRVIETSQSLIPVQRKATLGLNTAKNLSRDGEIIRFAVHLATMCEIGGAQLWRSELEARVALNDYESALALAQGIVIKEERLQSLAAIARAKSKKGIPLEPELIDLIRNLYDQIEVESLGAQSIDIASDLLFVDTSLAIDLLEKTSSTAAREGSLDWALASLTASASMGGPEGLKDTDIIDKIKEKITDPVAKSFSSAASVLFGNYDGSDVIEELKTLEKPSDKIALLRLWLSFSDKKEGVADVIEHAIELVLKTTELSPDARLLRHLTRPLPFLEDNATSKKLIGLFEGILRSAERLGPTLDYIKTQLNLASAEVKYDTEAAKNRMIDAYLYATQIKDLDIKTSALANIHTVLEKIDPDKHYQTKDQLHDLITDDLEKSIEFLLEKSACQFSATQGALTALSGGDYSKALELASILNTQDRRNKGFNKIIVSYLKKAKARQNMNFVKNALNKITDEIIFDETLCDICKQLPAIFELGYFNAEEIKAEIMRIRDVKDPQDRCELYCIIIRYLGDRNDHELLDIIEMSYKYLDSDWRTIDVGWIRVDVGYRIASELAGLNESKARSYLKESDELKHTIFLSDETSAQVYMLCIRLVIRSYTGLITKKIESEWDLKRIEELISRIPSYGNQAIQWGYLAVRCHGKGRIKLCNKIVSHYLRPCLSQITDKKSLYYQRIVLAVSPALFLAHKTTAYDDIESICEPLRELAYSRICGVIKTKTYPTDSYEHHQSKDYELDYMDVSDLCETIAKLSNDTSIVYQIQDICLYLINKKARYKITDLQKREIVRKLKIIVEDKLPDTKNIQHEGYKILALAFLESVLPQSVNTFDKFIEDAGNIDNDADKAFVLFNLGRCIKRKRSTVAQDLYAKAISIVDNLPSVYDKASRYEGFAEQLLHSEKTIAKECINKAIYVGIPTDDPSLHDTHKSLVDIAYRIDPSFASTVASMIDDDPARLVSRYSMGKKIKELELKNEVLKPNFTVENHVNKEYPKVAWQLLGSLNAKRIVANKFQTYSEMIQKCSSLPITESFPVFALAIENANIKYENTPHATEFLKPLFDGTLLGAELLWAIVSHSTSQQKKSFQCEIETVSSTHLFVRAGERAKAIEYIQSWMEADLSGYLKLCDPYFGPEELDILKLILAVNPLCNVSILTSRKHQKMIKLSEPIDEYYRDYWHANISEQEPPPTEIIIFGVEQSGEPPIHDRWLLSKDSGLRLGASLNSLGITKDTEISTLSKGKVNLIENKINQYFGRLKRDHRGKKLLYSSFSL
jgi:hypothetical protein